MSYPKRRRDLERRVSKAETHDWSVKYDGAGLEIVLTINTDRHPDTILADVVRAARGQSGGAVIAAYRHLTPEETQAALEMAACIDAERDVS